MEKQIELGGLFLVAAAFCFVAIVVYLLTCDLEKSEYYFVLMNVFKRFKFNNFTVQIKIIDEDLRWKIITVKINGKNYIVSYTKQNMSFLKELEAKSEELFKQESPKSADLPIDIYINNLYDHH